MAPPGAGLVGGFFGGCSMVFYGFLCFSIVFYGFSLFFLWFLWFVQWFFYGFYGFFYGFSLVSKGEFMVSFWGSTNGKVMVK